MEIHERRYLLRAVFEKFKTGMPRTTAADIIKSINILLPAKPQSTQEFNFEGINDVRRKLGIETW